MIQIKYKLLFEVEILHDFYRTGKSPDFQLVPSSVCRRHLRAFGLHFSATASGGQVYAKVNADDSLMQPLLHGLVFTFLMILQNPRFGNFSAINLLKPRHQRYYFNNLVENLSSEGDPLLVANTNTKNVSDADLLYFVRSSFSYSHESSAAIQQSDLLFTDAGLEFHQVLNNHNNVFNFSYDLRGMGIGRATFSIDGTEKEKLYVLPDDEIADVFGVVEIHYKNDLPPSYQFQSDLATPVFKSYKIPFTNRATRWRYIINKRFNKTLTGVTISPTNGNAIAFSVIPNPPADHIVVASNEPVALREDPVAGLQLRDQSDKVLIAHLPNPSLMLVRTEGSDTFSDILITI